MAAAVVTALVVTLAAVFTLGRGGDPVAEGTAAPSAPATSAAPLAEPSPAPEPTATTGEVPEPPPEALADTVARLEVPALDADAPVVRVGVTANRVLQVPPDPDVLGLWSDGATPGDGTGSVVLVGHVDYQGREGVLHDLSGLGPGETAQVAVTGGSSVEYVVERVDTYRKSALPYEDIFQFDVPERLVLVTCGGRIDRSTGHYDSNVVAYLRRV